MMSLHKEIHNRVFCPWALHVLNIYSVFRLIEKISVKGELQTDLIKVGQPYAQIAPTSDQENEYLYCMCVCVINEFYLKKFSKICSSTNVPPSPRRKEN